MAHQGDGWPLGLQRLNTRFVLARSIDLCGSISFSTMLTSTTTLASPTVSSCSSFNLDSKCMEEPYEHYRRRAGVPLRSLLGVFSTLHFSRSRLQRQQSSSIINRQAMNKPKTWLYCLCSKPVSDDHEHNVTKMTPQLSLGFFLEEERKRSRSNADVSS